ncbi:hypothetical protein L3X38_037737 [Prunus dulcis]|uniref:Uncharacterized protein n=1 Tax=Prunus dulcis TaxID=3755 RepID=A0AAD4V3Z1_PRUDU|nr:hypothetical protein L3X38_037737 [Prunus dulcis]
MSGTPTIHSLLADSQKHAVTHSKPYTWTRASIATTKGHPYRKDDWCGTRRGKLFYLDWAPDSETKVGQALILRGRETKFGS